MANSTDTTGAISFSLGCQTQIPEDTTLALRSEGDIGSSAPVKGFSCRISLNQRLAPAGQRSVPFSCNTKASPPKRPAYGAAHCHGPYSSGGVSEARENGRSFFGRCPLHLAEIPSLHHLSQCEAQVPHPLAHHLPQFLPTLSVGAPAVGIFFDIFIGEHRPRSAPRP